MSYEVIDEKHVSCPCGNGCIKIIIEENDFFQRKEDLTVDCMNCKNKYEIKKEISKSKPKHESELYFLVEKNNKNSTPIKLNF